MIPPLRTRLAARTGQRPASLLSRLAAAESDPLVALLFDEAPVATLAVDDDGRIVRANKALHAMAGPTAGLEPGAPALPLFGAERRETTRAEIEALLLGHRDRLHGLATRLTVAGVKNTGAAKDTPEAIDIQLFAERLRGPGGEAEGALLRLVDISRQVRLETQLAHSQKLQAVGQLAGGIAHDFNNLLTTILGAAESIAGRTPDAETGADIRHIQSSAMRGAALVRQLLAFGRQQGQPPRLLAVNQTIAEAAELLRRLIGRHIKLALELDTPGPMIRADPTQIDQVLVNLAVNARDAMQAGGTLHLRSARETIYREQTHGTETILPGRYAVIEVADTGSGIPPEVLPRIFDPFFTTRREQGGHGLGLATVLGIVRQAGGFLTVDSTPGQGTRFRILLPLADGEQIDWRREAAAPQAALSAAAPAATPSAPPTILLVEDEEPVRRLAMRSFQRRGWQVLAAESGEAALALLDAAPAPDAPAIAAVVTDMVMPGMDGATLVRTLRARPGLARLPAILVSGYAEESLRRDIGTVGTAFLPKPYAQRDLITKLESLLPAASTA